MRVIRRVWVVIERRASRHVAGTLAMQPAMEPGRAPTRPALAGDATAPV